MTDTGPSTVVYEWAGPPRICVSTLSVSHNGNQWLQHKVEADEGGIGAVVVATFAGKHLVVEHFRPVTGRTLTEFPRGFGATPLLDVPPECHACETGARELMEETGIAAARTDFLGYIWPDSGLLGNKVAVVSIVAESLEAVGSVDGETDGFFWITQDELAAAIRAGDISDGITLAAYAMWRAAEAVKPAG